MIDCDCDRDWLIELSDNKLSDINWASELVENRSFQPITIEGFVTFMIIKCNNVR